MTALVYTLTETLRYRGKVGQWSWVLHRLTGLGVVFFVAGWLLGIARNLCMRAARDAAVLVWTAQSCPLWQ
mgnify:CR=1 FL=1